MAEEKKATDPAVEGIGAALKVLVVEDNAVNQRIASWRLGKLGHDVTVVASGFDALDATERVDFDLILMDVQMPDIDGLEVTRRIREREAGSREERSYIVAMTALVLGSDSEACLAAGMDDFLSKPLRPERLDAVVQNARRRLSVAGEHKETAAPAGETYSLQAFIDRLDDSDRADVIDAARIFRKSLPEDRRKFKEVVAVGEVEAIRFEVHTLTGVSGVFEIPHLLRIAEAIEAAADAGDKAGLEKECARFDEAVGQLIDEINSVLEA